MENTLQIIETNGIQTVSARELYKGLEITDRFNRWFESLLKYGFEENQDFRCVKTSTQQNQYGGIKEIDDYSITLDMAKQICMLQRTEIGKKYRTYLINLEKAWNNPEMVMKRALEYANKRAEQLYLECQIMQPKAECYDELIDATGLFNLQTTAKMLGVNFNWFKNCLIDNEYLYRGSHDTLLPYANRKNIFVVKEWTKNGIAGFQTLVTPKGTDILRTLFKVWGKDKDDSKKILEETTDIDLSESFSIEQVAKIIEEPEETVLNFIAAKGWIDPETKKPLLPLKYIDSNGRITVDGKDKIVSAFFTIKKTEKGMKAFSCGKGE